MSFNANAYLSIPSVQSSQDSIRTSGGTECRASSNNAAIYAGVYNDGKEGGYYNNEEDKGFQVGIVYNFGIGRTAINCDKILKQEETLRDLEIDRLKEEIKSLKQLQALSELEASGGLPEL